MTSDPIRLLDDPSALAALRDDLVHATDVTVHGLDHAAGLAALQSATASSATASGGLSMLTKLGLGAAVAGGVVALWLGLSSDPTPSEPVASAPVMTPAPKPASPPAISIRPHTLIERGPLKGNPMPTIAYQLYCSRNWPLVETLDMLERVGIDAVEGFGPLFDDPAATRRLLDDHEMTMPSAHFAFDLVAGDPDRALEIAKTIGIEKVIVPFLTPDQRPTDKSGWQAFAGKLAEAGKPIRDAGLGYGWHNHDFEFLPCDDGTLGIEEIAAQLLPELLGELRQLRVLLELIAVRVLELRHTDIGAIDTRRETRADETVVQADENERGTDEGKDSDSDPASEFFANILQHDEMSI